MKTILPYLFFILQFTEPTIYQNKNIVNLSENEAPIGTINKVYYDEESDEQIKYVDVTFSNDKDNKRFSELEIRQGQLFIVKGDNDFQILTVTCIDIDEYKSLEIIETEDQTEHKVWTTKLSDTPKNFIIKAYCQNPGWPIKGRRFSFYTGDITTDESNISENCSLPQRLYNEEKKLARSTISPPKNDLIIKSGQDMENMSGTTLTVELKSFDGEECTESDYADAFRTALINYLKQENLILTETYSIDDIGSSKFNHKSNDPYNTRPKNLTNKYSKGENGHYYPTNNEIRICLNGGDCPTNKYSIIMKDIRNIQSKYIDGKNLITFICDLQYNRDHIVKEQMMIKN